MYVNPVMELSLRKAVTCLGVIKTPLPKCIVRVNPKRANGTPGWRLCPASWKDTFCGSTRDCFDFSSKNPSSFLEHVASLYF